MPTPKTIYRKDYTAPAFQVDNIDLHFDLHEEYTEITSVLNIHRLLNAQAPLVLNGKDIELISLQLNNQSCAHQINDENLTIEKTPYQFTLKIITRCKPQLNTTLEGLYKVKDLFCTQCEAHGFRKMTYYFDHPDVLTKFTTTITADKTRYPALLSNGNLIAQKELPHNRHSVTWQDPFNKPCYLFALVAGNLGHVEDEFITQSGRHVKIKIYVDKGDEDKCTHAMQSIKKAMRWDEKVYGREYDLDIFMIVSTHDFNFGAMENKGLNIFNSKYILAKPETATDEDYTQIERVIGHEYFHNWSGNRVTCRDWFQLSLKEGLTVFRDAQFSADMTSAPVVRIGDANIIRAHQFAQDAGPMAHPVRPDSYIEINNFYTVTVYNKGAEVVRMLHTLLGKEGFRRGMDLYFSRFDGQAVTIEDFVQAHADANNINLTQFLRWYAVAGTPELFVTTHYDAAKQQYQLTIKQTAKEPFYMPIKIGLLNSTGKEIHHQVLTLNEAQQTFTIDNIKEKPLLSLLRDFSAPVKIHYDYNNDDLAFLLHHDTDPFARWDAGQQLAVRLIQRLMKDRSAKLDQHFVEAWRNILHDKTIDGAFATQLLALPSEQYLIELFAPVDLDNLLQARYFMRQQLAEQLHNDWLMKYQELKTQNSVNARVLKNRCLAYLNVLDDAPSQQLIIEQLTNAKNMTDEIAALSLLCNSQSAERTKHINAFYAKWKNETLVLDKWFSALARAERSDVLQEVKTLLNHPAFNIKNPNKARALLGAFAANTKYFHAANGEGYAFLREQILLLDKINPMIAARLIEPFTHWRKYDQHRQQLIKQELETIKQSPNLSKDLFEIVEKSLG